MHHVWGLFNKNRSVPDSYVFVVNVTMLTWRNALSTSDNGINNRGPKGFKSRSNSHRSHSLLNWGTFRHRTVIYHKFQGKVGSHIKTNIQQTKPTVLFQMYHCSEFLSPLRLKSHSTCFLSLEKAGNNITPQSFSWRFHLLSDTKEGYYIRKWVLDTLLVSLVFAILLAI